LTLFTRPPFLWVTERADAPNAFSEIEQGAQSEKVMKTKLFVGNLSYSTGDTELRTAFEPHGRVVAAEVITDRLTGQSRGFGFVEFGTVEEANLAQGAMHESLLDGRNIQVNTARERGSSSSGALRKAGNGRDRR